MKRLLLIVLPLLLIVGCSKPINEDSLIDRNGVKYQQDSQKPYSGKVFRLWENGEKKLEGCSYKNGKKDGLWIYWYWDGQKGLEGNYKDGKEDGLWTYWYLDGDDTDLAYKPEERTYKDGKKVRWTNNPFSMKLAVEK